MTMFDKKEMAEEGKAVLDAAQEFRVAARRNKWLGLWVAEMLGIKGADAKGYALDVVRSDMEEAGEEDVFRKVKQDFIKAGIDVSDDEIRDKMGVFLTEARQQIIAEDAEK